MGINIERLYRNKKLKKRCLILKRSINQNITDFAFNIYIEIGVRNKHNRVLSG